MRIQNISATDPITQDILNRALDYSTLLRNHIEFYTGFGDSTVGRKEQGSLDIQSRELDKPYTETVVKPEYFPTYRKILGANIKLDVARERLGFNLPSEMAVQLRRECLGIALGFHNMLINGNAETETKQFNGLKKLVTETQKIKVGTNGLTLKFGNQTDKTAQQNLLEALDITIQKCLGINKIIITNGTIIARLNHIAREYIQYTTDTFGKRITTYNGIPLINIEEGGNNIMGFNEECGTAKNCSSIYVVSFEEAAGLSFLTVPEGFKVYPMQKVGNFYENMIELITDSALFRDRAIAKLEGLIA